MKPRDIRARYTAIGIRCDDNTAMAGCFGMVPRAALLFGALVCLQTPIADWHWFHWISMICFAVVFGWPTLYYVACAEKEGPDGTEG